MKLTVPLLTLALATGVAAMVILNRPNDGDSLPAPSTSNVSAQAVSSSGLYVYPPVKDATLTYGNSGGTIEMVWVTDVRRSADGSVAVEVVAGDGETTLPPVTIITEPDGGFRTSAKDLLFDIQREAEMQAGGAMGDVIFVFSGDEYMRLPSIRRMRAGATTSGHYTMSGSGMWEVSGKEVEVDTEIDVDWSSRGFEFEELPFLRDEVGTPIPGDDRTVRAFRTATEFKSTVKMDYTGDDFHHTTIVEDGKIKGEGTADGHAYSTEDEAMSPERMREIKRQAQEALQEARRAGVDIPADAAENISSMPTDIGGPDPTTEQTQVTWFVPGFGIVYQQTIDENGTTSSKWLLESTVEP